MSTTDKDLNTFVPVGKKISIAGQDFEIKPFVLKNRIKVVRIISEAMLSMSTSMTKDIQDNPIRAIPLLINTAGEKLIDIYEIVLEKDKTWLGDSLHIKDEIEILTAIFEVNDIPFIVSRIREMLPKIQRKA
jgi:hypothetical protein